MTCLAPRLTFLSLATVTLAACAPQVPAGGTAVITVASGSFFGSTSTQIYADGTVVLETARPDKPGLHRVQKATPQAFVAAAAVIAAEGAKTKAAVKPEAAQCLDYGTDLVTASPAIAGFDGVSANCPDAAVTALMDHVLAALAAK